MDVPVHAHEHFLDQVLSAFTITRRAIHEIQQTILVPVDQFVESALLTFQKGTYYPAIVELAKSFSRSRTRRDFNRTKSCVSHDPLHVGPPPTQPCSHYFASVSGTHAKALTVPESRYALINTASSRTTTTSRVPALIS